MKAAGCKSDDSNQFSQLEIWTARSGSSIRVAVALGFAAANASALIRALEKEAGVEVKALMPGDQQRRNRTIEENLLCKYFKKSHSAPLAI